MRQGIIIFGANGSGKTTLGKELAQILGFKHMDIEDYYFEKSEIPYTIAHSREECVGLMLSDIEKYHSFVLTAVTGDFGDIIPTFYKFAVLITAPLEIRLERIKHRAFEKHGERVCEGGDMYEANKKFIDFVSSRSLTNIDRFAQTLTCPVMQIDGTIDRRINTENIAKFYRETVLHSECIDF